MYHLVVLTLEQNTNTENMVVHPVALVDDSQLILVDCGFIGSLEKLKEELKKNDLEIEKLRRIIVTHHDHDHIANLANLKREYPDIEIYASANEKPYLEGTTEPFRLQQAKEMQKNLPDQEKDLGLSFIKILEKVENVTVDNIIGDGDIIPFDTKVEIIETFGHVKGHISVYVEDSRTLITGDALVVEDNELK
ncbi:MAG: MBL fold metallo-hydrolase, partial [Coprobacillaceae bacterium]